MSKDTPLYTPLTHTRMNRELTVTAYIKRVTGDFACTPYSQKSEKTAPLFQAKSGQFLKSTLVLTL